MKSLYRDVQSMPCGELTDKICEECLGWTRKTGPENGVWKDLWITPAGERHVCTTISFCSWSYCDHDRMCRNFVVEAVLADAKWREAFLGYCDTIEKALMASPRRICEWAYCSHYLLRKEAEKDDSCS